jgi:AcrR family transcriptional regulator
VRVAIGTERKIEAAVASPLKHRSFADITTREVASHAGVSEATLFRHITSKSDLFLTVYGNEMDLVMDVCEREDRARAAADPAPADTYLQRVLRVYEARVAHYQENFINAAQYLLAAFDPSSPRRPRTVAQGERMIRFIENILEEAKEAGLLRAGVSPRLIAENIHAVELHEVVRTPLREYPGEQAWERLRPRIQQLLDLVLLNP